MNLSRFHKSLFVCLTILFSASFASAARYSVATGNWNSTATWSAQSGGTPGASVPAMGDAVTIEGGFTVTVTSNAACTSISYSTANSTSTLTVNSGITLAVSAAITIPRSGAGLNTLDVGAGTVSAASIAFTNSFTNVRHQITISTGTLTVSGNITINPTGSTSPSIIFSAAGTLNVGGTFFSTTIGGTLTTFSGSTVNYTGVAQTGMPATYSNLTLSGSGAKTFATTPTVNGVLSLEGTASIVVTGAGVVTYGSAATLQYNKPASYTATAEEWKTPFLATGGVVIKNIGAITIDSAKVFGANTNVPLNIDTNATLITNNLALTFHGDFIKKGTLTAGTSNITITGTTASQNIAGFTTTGIGVVSITKSSGTATLTGNVSCAALDVNGASGTLKLGTGLSHTVSGFFSITAGTLKGGSSTLNLGGTGTNAGTFTTDTSTVNWNGGAQTVAGLTYYNLTLSGSGTKTTTGVTVNGTLSMEGTATASAAITYGASATLQYKGSALQTTGAEFPSTWSGSGGVKIENASGVKLGAAKNIGANPFTIGSNVSNSNFNDSGYQLTATGSLNLASGYFNLGAATATTFPAFSSTTIAAGTTVNYLARTTQTVKGLTYSNLTISGTGNNYKTTDGNITVNGVLNLVSANASATKGALDIDTNNYSLTMGASATTTGTGDVTGIVTRNTFVALTPYSFGNQFTTINFSNLGTLPTTMSVKIVLTTSHTWNVSAIHRYYSFIQTGGSNLAKVTVNLHYLVSELNGNNMNDLALYDYKASPYVLDDHGRSNHSTIDYWGGLANVNLTYLAQTAFNLKYWTLGTSAAGNDCDWIGYNSTDWNDAGNWAPGVPNDSSHVHIYDAGNTNFDPILPTGTTTIGMISIDANGILNATNGTPTLTITKGAGAWNNSGTFNAGTSTVLFTSASATMADPTNFYNITIANGATLTLGVDNVMRISGTLSLLGTGVLNAGLNHNTVEYNGTAQTVINPNGSTPGYHKLILSGSGIKTMPASAMNISGGLYLSGTASATAAAALTITDTLSIGSGTTFNASTYTHNLSYYIINNGTFTAGASTVNLNGTAIQVISGNAATTFNNLIINNSTGVSLTTNASVAGSLTLTSGLFDVGAYTLSLAGTTSGSGSISSSGTINFNGSVAQTISNNASLTTNNLTINNAAGVSLSTNLTVSNLLTLTNGALNLNTYTLNIGGSIAKTSGSINSGTGAVNLNGASNQTLDGTIIPTITNLVVNNSAGITLSSNITISSSLTLTSGTLSIGGHQLTISGSITKTSGNINGSSGTVVFNSASAQTVPASMFVSDNLNNLTINNAAGVTLGGTLNLTGTLTPTVGTLYTGGYLRLISSATTTANIANGSCITCSYISGSVAVERYVPPVSRRYRFLSSPIISPTLDDWQNEMFVTGTGGSTNGFDQTTSNSSSCFYYDESTNTWPSPASTSYSLETGKGYRIFVRGDRSDNGRLTGTNNTQNTVTLDLVGSVNQGNVSMPVTYTATSNSFGAGWCLLGNPYPSAYDWLSFFIAGNSGGSGTSGTNFTNISGTITIYNPTSGSYESYNAGSNTGTGAMSNGGIIPPGSAFWVRSTAASPSLTFTEAYKINTNAGTSLFKKANGNFSITLIKDSLNSDEMIVKYMPAATTEVDNYDIVKMVGGEVNISSITPLGKLLTGNCKPFNGVSDTINLFISVKSLMKYTLKFQNVAELITGKSVELYDAVTGIKTDLTTTTEYLYTPDTTIEKLSNITRFKILVGSGKNTGIDNVTNSVTPVLEYRLYPTVTSSSVSVYASIDNNEKNNITITDIAGKTIFKTNDIISNNQPKEIDLSGFVSGLYLINISNAVLGTTQTFKVIKQ